MRRFFRNTKGAVTVFVSLLMIPAILISGTAVDLARMHTARSSLQNANQLAANATLTQYNALLNDIYGLFGIMEDDPILFGMLIEYINVSVFGGDDQDRGLGTFQPFHGSNLQAPEVSFAQYQNLGNSEVLRQQILEYTALRAPYVLLEDIKILKIVDSFGTLLADARAIDIKMHIEDELEELDRRYQRIYNQINTVNSRIDDVNALTPQVNPILDSIKVQLDLLVATRARWTTARDNGDSYLMGDLTRKYNGILGNISALTGGGSIVSDWVEGYLRTNSRYRTEIVDGEAVQVRENYTVWIQGYWDSRSNNPRSLNDVVSDLRTAINSLDNALTSLIDLSIAADVKRQEIEGKVINLHNHLGRGVSDALKIGMTEPKPDSVMCHFRELVTLDGMTLEEMARAVADSNGAIITQVRTALNNMGFGNVSGLTISEPMVSLSELENLTTNNIFPISFVVDNRGGSAPDRLGNVAAVSNYRFNFNLNLTYYQNMGPGTQHMEFYTKLHDLYGDPDEETARTAIRSAALEMVREMRRIFVAINEVRPGGRLSYIGPEPYPDDRPFSDNWGSSHNAARRSARNALNPTGATMSMFGSMFEGVAEQLLLVTYGTRMFSNYTTSINDKTMSRVSMNRDVNFFFQSEQEYLFNGNLRDAMRNLNAVAGWIMLIRLVMNYISTFVIDEIRNTLKLFRTGGLKGIILAEVVRLLWALGESVTDVIALLLGNNAHVFKWDFKQWNLGKGLDDFIRDTSIALLDKGVPSTSGMNDIVKAFEEKINIVSAPGVSIGIDKGEIKFDFVMNYDQYLWLMLLTRSPDTLTRRIGHLISLNVTHYKGGPGAADVNYLHGAHTGFTITTAVDMRMLFLGLPMAQNFASEQGITAPSTTLTVTARDYRGY